MLRLCVNAGGRNDRGPGKRERERDREERRGQQGARYGIPRDRRIECHFTLYTRDRACLRLLTISSDHWLPLICRMQFFSYIRNGGTLVSLFFS